MKLYISVCEMIKRQIIFLFYFYFFPFHISKICFNIQFVQGLFRIYAIIFFFNIVRTGHAAFL